MWQFTKEQVYEKLTSVIDPELMVNIVDLGLIYEVSMDEKYVRVLMTLTSPGCPLAPVIKIMVEEALVSLPGFSKDMLMLEITFDPPWVPDMMKEEVRAELGLD